MRLLLSIAVVPFALATLLAQEYVQPLSYDLHKKKDTENRLRISPNTVRTSVGLPFIDDFSQDHFQGNEEGNEVLWEELNASRHTSFSIDPVSVGVAVFDGLDQFGQPYVTGNANSNGRADTLTSMDIDLSAAENVVLSFYYQAGGYGEPPEFSDSLLLQFFSPIDGTWSTVWFKQGETVNPFTQVLLEVEDPYLVADFRFRFMNYGRLTGAVDQWALDWVYLGANRSVDDESLEDVGFYRQASSLLSGQFSAMPWRHFIQNASASMITQKDVFLKNNRDAGALISETGYEVFYSGSSIASFIDPQSPTLFPLSIDTITHEVVSSPNDFVYPTGVANDMAQFEVEFYFETSPDDNADNNLLRFTQDFRDYYSYDDGQADNAYGIQNFNGSGKVALRYDLQATDTILGVDIAFLYQAAIGTSLEDQLFYLTIWEENNEIPGDIIYQDLIPRNVQFASDGGVTRYYLQSDTVILEAGEYFFGWQQPDNISINVGNDISTNLNEDLLKFDIGFGWQNSGYDGVIMLHPVITSPLDLGPPSSIEESIFSAFDVWPIPSSDIIYISGRAPRGSYATIYDLEGRVLHYERLVDEITSLDLSFTSEGLYILEFTAPNGARRVEKIVIKR